MITIFLDLVIGYDSYSKAFVFYLAMTMPNYAVD